ncbi:MAG: response regulator [Myxococcales bacterium]|nr:response regulator [Myxococcales bacterium]
MSRSEPKQVLVVDDEPLFLKSLADGLAPFGEREGFVVHTAHNGQDAILTLQARPIDLVLTDLRMPGVDGFQLIAWMIGQKKSTPVVVMTALPSLEARVQLRESGVFAVLQKPVDLADVHRCIRAELDARRARVEGLATSAFLQLVSMERVSCVLTIRSGPRVGTMHISGGDLVHAELEDKEGLAAAHALVGLPDSAIDMVERDDVRSSGLRVPLAEVVLDALRTHDEQSRGRGSITSPPAPPQDVDIEFDIMKSVRPPALEKPTPPPPARPSTVPPQAKPTSSPRPPSVAPKAASVVPSPPSVAPSSTARPPRAKFVWPELPDSGPVVSPLAGGAEGAPAPTSTPPAQPTPAPTPPEVTPKTAPPEALEPEPRAPSVTAKKERSMNIINVDKANAAVNKLRESLGAGLVATDVWNIEDGMSIAGFNSQPVATALFNRITDLISETLSESGFPALNKYYMLDLDGDKLVVVLPLGSYRAGMLVDKKKAQLGVIVSVALPKYVAMLEEAIRG